MPPFPCPSRTTFAVLLVALGALSSACGGEPAATSGTHGTGGGAGSGGSAPAPEVGTVELFAQLAGSSEGLAFAPGPDGENTLYVGAAHKLFRVGPDGSVAEHVALPGPLGMAVRADGDLLVCGKAEGTGDVPGVIWRVTPQGEKSVFVGPDQVPFDLTNFLAVAPDDTLVFSDSAADKLYRAEADGTGVALLTDTISYPNGLAFSKDGATVFVASWDTKKVHSLARSGDGTFEAPEVFAADVENVDGISIFASGDLLLVASGDGIVRYGLDAKKTSIAPGTSLGLPANGAFGAGAYGDGWLYVTNLFGPKLYRVYVGEGGAPLPVR